MPHESLMNTSNFFKHGQVGKWLGQANSVTCLPKGQAGIQVFVEPCCHPKSQGEGFEYYSNSQRKSLPLTFIDIMSFTTFEGCNQMLSCYGKHDSHHPFTHYLPPF